MTKLGKAAWNKTIRDDSHSSGYFMWLKSKHLVSISLLVGYLLVTATALARDTTELPEVWTTVQMPERAACISVNAEGHVRVSDGGEMSLPVVMPDELNTFLAWLTTNRKELPIAVKIDRRTKYKHVEPVFGALSKHGVKRVYLMVLQKTKPMDPELQRFFQEIAHE